MATGSEADSEASTPSHLLQDRPSPTVAPPPAQGASYHPMSDFFLLNTALELEPDNVVNLAARDRLLRQAQRLWELHTTGAIPPLDGQTTLELTVVLGYDPPDATNPPVFPYVDRKYRKRALHSHTAEELRNHAEAAEARHRRRHIAPLGHALAQAAEAAKRRRRIIPPKRGRWNRPLQSQRKHMPLEDDPIEEFSPLETPGMSSTDQLPVAAPEPHHELVPTAEDACDTIQPTAADTIVNTSDSSSSSASSSSQLNRQTGEWPELGEEEEVSSGDATVSSFSTVCYDAQTHSPLVVALERPHSAEVGQTPSMSCVVSSTLRARAIMVSSHSDDDDNEPLIHLAPSSWLTWFPAAVVACPLLVTKAGLKRLQRRWRHLYSHMGISVYSSKPKTRPVHRFAGICIGEASNPGPPRLSIMSLLSASSRDLDSSSNVPAEESLLPAEAAGLAVHSPHDEDLPQPTSTISLAPTDIQAAVSSWEDTPGWDAPRGMNDPAPTRARPRRSHDARPAEAGGSSLLPPSINKVQIRWLDGSKVELHCSQLRNGSYQWKVSSGTQRYAKTGATSRAM
eukprot:863033-Amphidinium_carterae.1